MKRFLAHAPFETVVTPKLIEEGLFEIRDELDYPVLYSAVVGLYIVSSQRSSSPTATRRKPGSFCLLKLKESM